jgi:hypothetical protein
MSDLYQFHEHPGFENPPVIVGLDGWIDAGLGAANAIATLLSTVETTTIASFDSDALLDHRARRPTMHLLDGVVEDLRWPATELRAARDTVGNGFLMLVGAEPDHLWHAFTAAVVDLFLELGVSLVAGFGAYPAPAPHTRPAMLSCTASTPELAQAIGFVRGTLDVPAGVQAAIEQRSHAHGIRSLGIWAQVPHYVAGMPYPKASMALIEGFNALSGLQLDFGTLAQEAEEAQARIDTLIAGNDEHAAMVRSLEQQLDESSPTGPLPSGEDIAAEFERFLRDQPPGGTA